MHPRHHRQQPARGGIRDARAPLTPMMIVRKNFRARRIARSKFREQWPSVFSPTITDRYERTMQFARSGEREKIATAGVYACLQVKQNCSANRPGAARGGMRNQHCLAEAAARLKIFKYQSLNSIWRIETAPLARYEPAFGKGRVGPVFTTGNGALFEATSGAPFAASAALCPKC